MLYSLTIAAKIACRRTVQEFSSAYGTTPSLHIEYYGISPSEFTHLGKKQVAEDGFREIK